MDAERPIPVTFYTKPGCHLCQDVADHLEELAARWPLQVTAVDITRDLDVHRRYWDKIPVVVIGPHKLSAPIPFDRLAQAVAKAGEDRDEVGPW